MAEANNNCGAMSQDTIKRYETARMAHTGPSAGMVGVLSSRGPQPPQANRLLGLAANMDGLVSTARIISERLESAVNRIHGETPELTAAAPDHPVGSGVLGTLEQFGQMIEAAQRRALRALSRLEEVG